MEFKSRYFPIHMNDLCKDILAEAMQAMIIELSANAIFVMNTEMNTEITLRTADTLVDLLKHSIYRFMPFHLVCEGFQRGAMGELGGTTRFTVRNVNVWMKGMYEKHSVLTTVQHSKEDQRKKAEELASYRRQQKISTLYGEAFYRKMEWCHKYLITSEQYDRLTLDKIVAKMQEGFTAKELEPSMIL
jgi:hypothetical protein